MRSATIRWNASSDRVGRIGSPAINAPHPFAPSPQIEAAIDYVTGVHIDAPWETNGHGLIIMNPPIGLVHAKRFGKLGMAIQGTRADWPGLERGWTAYR